MNIVNMRMATLAELGRFVADRIKNDDWRENLGVRRGMDDDLQLSMQETFLSLEQYNLTTLCESYD
jgi:hypothetical protein